MEKYKTILDIDKTQCCGCSACYNICPKDSISMKYDDEGFFAPVIDEEKCIKCGKCTKVCPAIHPKKDNDLNPDMYLARVSDELLYESSSGGAFVVLAEHILQNKGVVFGAAYNEMFEVTHQAAENMDALKKLKKSKYVQSQIGLVYRRVKTYLEEGRYVLFSGTPCQVAGLHNYLDKKYERLYSVDLFCTGAPAPLSWIKYLRENFSVSELKDIEFRYKNENGGRPLRLRFIYKDGKEIIERSNKNPYYYHFSKKFGLRLSCYNCEGAVLPRVGDFSVGDFWGADKYYPDLVENAKGLSMLFCNNQHSKDLFSLLKHKFVLLQPISLKESRSGNRKYKERPVPEIRKQFFKALKSGEPFNKAVFDTGKYDIAIYGATLGANYGGLITYYALYKACVKMGYSTIMIRPFKRSDKEDSNVIKPHGTRFCEEYITLSDTKFLKDFKQYNDIADIFLLGSDQIWNIECFKGRKLSFYLDFVDNTKKKIAYAASFGASKPTFLKENEHLYPQIYHWLNQLDYTAIREEDGVDICRQYFDMEATHVLDPVFLLDRDDYHSLAEKAGRKPAEKYMVVYELTPKPALTSIIQSVSKETGLKRINMGPGNRTKWEKKIANTDIPWISDIQVEEWIYNIEHSEYVVTDSFHGTCFAIMFQKPFIIYLPENARSERISSLLGKLELLDRWCTSLEDFENRKDIIQKPIDYNRVSELLKQEKEKSLFWLKNAISHGKTVSNYSVESILKSLKYSSISAGEVPQYLSNIRAQENKLVFACFSYVDYLIRENLLNRYTELIKTDEAVVLLLDTSTRKELLSHGIIAHLSYKLGTRTITVSIQACDSEKKPALNKLIVNENDHKNIYQVPNSAFLIIGSLQTQKMQEIIFVE